MEQCVRAGATFVVSPGFDDAVVDRCRALGVPVLPGIATATELMRAVAAGLDLVKFFPAEALGGVRTIDALSAPFPDMRFLPSGGLSSGNIAPYLRHRSVVAAAGSWMLPRHPVDAGDGDALASCVTESVRLAGTLR